MIERILHRRTTRPNLERVLARLRSGKELDAYDRDVIARVIEALMRRGRQPGRIARGEFYDRIRQAHAACIARRDAERGRVRKRLPKGRWEELVEEECGGDPVLVRAVLSRSKRKPQE